MCSGSKSKPCPSSFSLAGESQMEQVPCKFSILLELAASDDLTAFKNEVENKGCDVDEPCYWYGRSISSKKMGFSQRTPLMMASMFGSLDVLKYILETGKANVNRASGSDQATALHCAVSGGSHGLHQAVRMLLNSDADPTCLDCNGNKPVDLVALVLRPSRRKALKLLLKGEVFVEEEKPVTPEKKEYPVDILLPDINNGIYSSDEFRMYSFKVKPCSRAYSHDWTECPFLHPGENARRRDPRKYPYSCVPCPDFRKGSCPKGDVCEYAHGVFESWLHPAQYKTRLCKDETGCARKVCFFAHKPEELRPVYASTGSALPSPKSFSPPVSPMASQKNMGLWSSPPPALQLPGSRLKASLTARNIDVEMELLGLKNNQLLEEMSRVSSSPSYLNRDFSRLRDLQPTNYEDSLRSLDPTARCHMMPNGGSSHSASQFQSPVGLHIQQNVAQLWPSSLASSPMRTSAFGFNSSSAVATAVMNSRSAAMMKRSLSLIDRASATQEPLSPANSMVQSRFSGWDSGRGDELNKLRKSYSFRNSMNRTDLADEPDVSWVNSLVRDVPQGEQGRENQPKSDIALPWSVDQLSGDQEQIVAI
ncbi:hypothetical protein SAY87_023139 [Trapa incisa]|uniref:C3H1-type domain-containing protein n=1 Tax=Trapa incisa TaxID=236973 RepID=A0AAN7Q5Y6_9MYRT|nr:hypothetical protein SAY87_023139 [Trapa incisa]